MHAVHRSGRSRGVDDGPGPPAVKEEQGRQMWTSAICWDAPPTRRCRTRNANRVAERRAFFQPDGRRILASSGRCNHLLRGVRAYRRGDRQQPSHCCCDGQKFFASKTPPMRARDGGRCSIRRLPRCRLRCPLRPALYECTVECLHMRMPLFNGRTCPVLSAA